MATPPSVVVYKDAYASGVGAHTRVLTQRTVATGDVIAVVATTGNYSQGYPASLAQTAGTATIGIVTLQRNASTNNFCGNCLFTFTVTSGGTLTLTVTADGTTNTMNYSTVWTYVASGCGGVGNTGMTTSSTTTITTSLATSQDSYVLAIATDWNATGGTTTTLTPAGGVLDAHETDGTADQSASGSFLSTRGGHWADVSAGTVSYGTTSPTSAKYNQVVCELLGTAGGVDFTATPDAADAGGAAYDAAAQIGAATAALYAGSATGISGSWSNAGNATGSTTGDYATWTDAAAGTSVTLELATFGAQAAVPAGSTVTSVTCVVRHGEAPSYAIASVTAQAYSGGTPVGSPQPLSAADAVHDDQVTFTGLTWADLADLRVRVTVTRD